MALRYCLYDFSSGVKEFLVFPEGSADLAALGSYSQLVAVSWSCSVAAPGALYLRLWPKSFLGHKRAIEWGKDRAQTQAWGSS